MSDKPSVIGEFNFMKRVNPENYILNNCANCGKDIKVLKSRLKHGCGKYCSDSCFRDSRAVVFVEKECPACKKHFMSNESSRLRSRKYCSQECAIKSVSRKQFSFRNDSNWTLITCVCGNRKEVSVVRLNKWGAKYCSRACYFKYGKILFDLEEPPIPKSQEGIPMTRLHGFYVFSNGIVINKFGKSISTRINKSGYVTIAIYYNGKYRRTGLHRILAESFIPNPENKAEVNHKDLNKQNNSLENLEWCTHQENMIHYHQNKSR